MSRDDYGELRKDPEFWQQLFKIYSEAWEDLNTTISNWAGGSITDKSLVVTRWQVYERLTQRVDNLYGGAAPLPSKAVRSNP